MTVRPPKALAPKNTLPDDPLSAALEHEILAEKAGTYARLLKRLEKALQEARSAQGATGTEKEQLLDAAGEALWYVMIQRDLCGFRRHDLFFKELKIPAAVRYRMGRAVSRVSR